MRLIMTLLDKVLSKFGYEKVAQVGPMKPENTLTDTGDASEKIIQQAPQNPSVQTYGNGSQELQSAPQQLAGEPNTPVVNLQQNTDGTQMQDASNPMQMQDNQNPTGGQTTDSLNTNQQSINSPYMDVNQVGKVNPMLAQNMKKAGIELVDKELFREYYKNACIKAAIKKIPLSEYFNGKR